MRKQSPPGRWFQIEKKIVYTYLLSKETNNNIWMDKYINPENYAIKKVGYLINIIKYL